MLIEHETAPSIALKVLQTGIFRGGPILGDAGLNAVSLGGIGYWVDQARWHGAIMTFEWQGPLAGKSPLQPAPNTLYDDKPHRVFIPVGTTEFLTLKDIRLMPDFTWEECVRVQNFPCGLKVFSPAKWYNALRSRTTRYKQESIRSIESLVASLACEPRPIRIAES